MRILEPFERATSCGLVANISGCCDIDAGGAFDESTFPGLDENRQAVALDNAAETIRLLTASLTANCPRTIRPCREGGLAASGWHWSGSTWTPHINFDGEWVNSCSCEGAACISHNWLDLGAIAEVISVRLDGRVLDPSEYTVLDDRYLIAQEGYWPSVQDMAAPATEVGTFEVVYRPGLPLGPAGEWALGQLACEYAKALCGQRCALPKNVTEITRRGVSMTIVPGLFGDGLTGIRDVDIFIQSRNPQGIRVPSGIASPDTRRI